MATIHGRRSLAHRHCGSCSDTRPAQLSTSRTSAPPPQESYVNSPSCVRRLALLIDCDNVPPGCADGVMDEVTALGAAIVKEAYADFKLTQSEAWSKACSKHGIQKVQLDRLASNRNGVDVAMAVRAMDLLYRREIDGLLLVSSDTDFMPLMARFDAEALPVYLVGQRHTPDRLRELSTRFIYVDSLLKKNPANTPGSKSKPPLRVQDFAPIVKRCIHEHAENDGWILLEELQRQLLQEDRHFDPRSYGFRVLVDLCAVQPRVVIERTVNGEVRLRLSRRKR
ncbi:NYN domain-containing protein [Mesorhizobium sp. CAU 1741]|uniref:NYN domain-containing protein n=1 Tax=Mesorhizobium sp. CAU 1741 TaxID=3140366 RepID=UPI00325C2556